MILFASLITDRSLATRLHPIYEWQGRRRRSLFPPFTPRCSDARFSSLNIRCILSRNVHSVLWLDRCMRCRAPRQSPVLTAGADRSITERLPPSATPVRTGRRFVCICVPMSGPKFFGLTMDAFTVLTILKGDPLTPSFIPLPLQYDLFYLGCV